MADINWCKEMAQKIPPGTEARFFIDKTLSQARGDFRYAQERLDVQVKVAVSIMDSWKDRPQIGPESLKECEREMDNLHGMEKAKRMLLGYIAARGLSPDAPAAPILLMGPPGVGKSTLAMAAAAGFQRRPLPIALGGSVSEEQIFGIDPMYVNAGPGIIVRGFQLYGRNLFFIFDELTKLPTYKPSHMIGQTTMLQIIDPLLGRHFVDRYLEYGLNLTQIPVIATGNTGDELIDPLKDRFQVIEMGDYSLDEKKSIAERHLFPNALTKFGLEDKVTIARGLIDRIVDDHARRTGVRQIERDLHFLLSTCALRIMRDGLEPPIHLDEKEHQQIRDFCRDEGGKKSVGFRRSA